MTNENKGISLLLAINFCNWDERAQCMCGMVWEDSVATDGLPAAVFHLAAFPPCVHNFTFNSSKIHSAHLQLVLIKGTPMQEHTYQKFWTFLDI